jgi:MYXO-CTERM domain-containing protein
MLARSIYDPVRFRLEPPPSPSSFQEWLGAALWRWRDALVFRPWIYGALGLVAVAVAALRRRRWPLFIALSGIASECGLFFVAPSADYRYSYWMIVSALIAALWLIAEAIGRATAHAAPRDGRGIDARRRCGAHGIACV